MLTALKINSIAHFAKETQPEGYHFAVFLQKGFQNGDW